MIKIATNHAITADQFIHVLTASGINRPTEDRGRMQRMLNNANVLLTAWDDEQLIGVLRGVSDRSYCTFCVRISCNEGLSTSRHCHQVASPITDNAGAKCLDHAVISA